MHCVSENPNTVYNSDQYLNIPGAYPLALSGLGSMGRLTAAQMQKKADHAAAVAAARQKHADAVAAAKNKRMATQAQHQQAQAAAKAAHAQWLQAHRDAVKARQDTAAHEKAIKAANKAKGHPGAAALHADLSSKVPAIRGKISYQQKRNDALKNKIRAKGRGKAGLFGFLSGLLGLGEDVPNQLVTIGPDGNLAPPPDSAGPYGPIASAGGGGDQFSALLPILLLMNQSAKGTPPHNCKPESNRPACVMYYANQQQQQQLMVLVVLLIQLLQQSQKLDQEFQQLQAQAGPSSGCPVGFVIDPNSGQCVPSGSGTPPLPPGYDPNYYAQQQMPYGTQISQEYGLPAVPADYGPQQQMGPMAYSPGGGASVYDPNMPAAYAGMPNPTDPYGDVATIPTGYATGGDFGGGGQDFIPTDINVSAGPMVYADWMSSDVQNLPPGSFDAGSGGDFGAQSVDAYADVALSSSPVYPMMPPPGSVQAGPTTAEQAMMASQGMPMQQRQMVAQNAPPPGQIIQSAPDEQSAGGLQTQDQASILASSFEDSGAEYSFG